MVVQGVRLRVEGLAVHDRKARSLYVGDEKALGPTRDDGNLDAGFAERRERLGEIEFLAGVDSREKLQRGHFLRRGRRLGWRDGRSRRTLTCDGVAEVLCPCHRRGRHGRSYRSRGSGRGGGRESSGLHRTGAKHHGFFEIRRLGLPCNGFAYVLQLVFAELDDVTVLQEVLLDRLTVDHGAVGAAEILEKRVLQDGDDDGVFPAYCQIIDLDVVVRLAADGGAFLGQSNFLEDQAVHAEYQLRHSSIPLLELFQAI